MKSTFPCDTCNASNTQMSIMLRCGTCYYQSGKMPTKYIEVKLSKQQDKESKHD